MRRDRIHGFSLVELPQAVRKGFTLVELLVVIGIIAVLISVLMPALTRAREQARRVTELSDLRQLTAVCVMYANEHKGMLPVGRRVAFWPTDDYVWFNYDTWLDLAAYGASDRIASCQSIREQESFSSGIAQPIAGFPHDTYLGWIYWGGRRDSPDDTLPNPEYVSPKRITDKFSNSSQTLWTCMCYDSAGHPWWSVVPHVGLTCRLYPTGMTPPPEGLVVSRMDGSASWVPFNELASIQQGYADIIYYQPD